MVFIQYQYACEWNWLLTYKPVLHNLPRSPVQQTNEFSWRLGICPYDLCGRDSGQNSRLVKTQRVTHHNQLNPQQIKLATKRRQKQQTPKAHNQGSTPTSITPSACKVPPQTTVDAHSSRVSSDDACDVVARNGEMQSLRTSPCDRGPERKLKDALLLASRLEKATPS